MKWNFLKCLKTIKTYINLNFMSIKKSPKYFSQSKAFFQTDKS